MDLTRKVPPPRDRWLGDVGRSDGPEARDWSRGLERGGSRTETTRPLPTDDARGTRRETGCVNPQREDGVGALERRTPTGASRRTQGSPAACVGASPCRKEGETQNGSSRMPPRTEGGLLPSAYIFIQIVVQLQLKPVEVYELISRPPVLPLSVPFVAVAVDVPQRHHQHRLP